MTCVCGNSYTVKSGDTLYLIAERELGDGDRWREIMQPDCTPFTEEEAQRLQPGDEICLPEGDGGSDSSFKDIVSEQTYATMFPNRDRLYSYNGLITATQRYTTFCNEGTDTQRRREAAAFLYEVRLISSN